MDHMRAGGYTGISPRMVGGTKSHGGPIQPPIRRKKDLSQLPRRRANRIHDVKRQGGQGNKAYRLRRKKGL